jgi:hypothetical protein
LASGLARRYSNPPGSASQTATLPIAVIVGLLTVIV